MDFSNNEWREQIHYSIPEGWWIRFGEQLCDEIEDALRYCLPTARDDFQIIDIKEKYGTLRIATNWETERLEEIFDKYEDLSIRTCIACGAPATKISTGWISSWCDRHAPKDAIPINEYLVDSIKEV